MDEVAIRQQASRAAEMERVPGHAEYSSVHKAFAFAERIETKARSIRRQLEENHSPKVTVSSAAPTSP